MVLKVASKFVSSLLVLTLSSAIVTLVLSQTVFSSQYLEGKLAETDSYVKLSTALSQEAAKSSALPIPNADQLIQGVVTPDVVKTKLDSALEQFQAYYQGKGPAPVLDLSDIANQAQALGVPIGDNTELSKPIQLTPAGTSRKPGQAFNNIRQYTFILSAVLLLVLVLICWKRHNYKPLPNVLISVGILLGIWAVFFSFTPGLLDRILKNSVDSNAFAAIFQGLAETIAHDLGKRYGIIALISLGVGIVVHVLLSRINKENSLSNNSGPARSNVIS